MRPCSKRSCVLTAAAACVLSTIHFGDVAAAAVISGSSSGYGLNVDISALGINLDVGPLPVGVSGTAPAPYNVSDSVLNVSSSDSVPLVVSGVVAADAANASVSSDVDGTAGAKTAMGAGGVVGTGIDVVTLPIIGPGITLLGLDGTLSSTAQISGDFGSFTATGVTVIEDLDLAISGIVLDLSAFVGVAVAPNTSIDLSAFGLVNSTLILNEQVVAPDQSSISVNALRLSLGLANITADIVLGHSEAQLRGVPEPSTIGLASLAAVSVAYSRRRIKAER